MLRLFLYSQQSVFILLKIYLIIEEKVVMIFHVARYLIIWCDKFFLTKTKKLIFLNKTKRIIIYMIGVEMQVPNVKKENLKKEKEKRMTL